MIYNRGLFYYMHVLNDNNDKINGRRKKKREPERFFFLFLFLSFFASVIVNAGILILREEVVTIISVPFLWKLVFQTHL